MVNEHAGGGNDLLDFADGDEVGQALALGRLDQAGGDPGLLQSMGVEKLEAIQVELDGTPGVRGDEVGEVASELGFVRASIRRSKSALIILSFRCFRCV